MERLYKLYLKLDGISRSMQKVEQEITKAVEKQIGFEGKEKLFSNDVYVDEVHAYASNGEFDLSYKEFVKRFNESIKDLEAN